MPQETKQESCQTLQAAQPAPCSKRDSVAMEERPTYEPVQVYSFNAFNTINTIQLYTEEDVSDVFAAVQAEATRFERLFSHTLPESSLVRINQARGTAVEVEPELAGLIKTGLHFCKATDGLFDITVGPLVELWNEAKRTGVLPSQEEREKACAPVDWRKVHVLGNIIQLEDPSARIVLGGIAKGYIADSLCSLLQQHGFAHGFVNLGGNVKAIGGKPAKDTQASIGSGTEARPFTIGLRVPQLYSLPENAFAHVQLAQGAVVTSGIYERGFKAPDGTFYHHILDPRTGMPAETDLVSATLICEAALEGDGYTTALIIMGLQRALSLVESLPNCEAVFVARNKNIYTTSGVGTTIPFTC